LAFFVTTRSAVSVTVATVVVAVAELFAVDVSAVVVAAFALFVITVPPGVAELTLTTRVNDADAPDASDALVALTVPPLPTAGVEGVHPAGAANETNVVFVGTASVNETLAAAAAPLFVTVIVYVMFEPALTGSGESLFATTRSARVGATAVTVVVAVAELFAVDDSVEDVEVVAVFVMVVAAGVPLFTLTTSVNVADAVAANDALVALTVPFEPTAGVDGVHPAGDAKETNVVFAGSGSLSETFAAAEVPLFVIVIVYVMFEPAVTGSGASLFVMVRSAMGAAATVVVAVALLLVVLASASVVDVVAVLLMIVPLGVPAVTCTTT